jgi:hypothetical protein
MLDTAPDRLADCRLPAALDPLELELGDQDQDPNCKTSHRRRAVEVALDRDEPGAGVGQAADRAQRVDRRAGEAVEPGNHEPAGFARLAAGECLLEHRSLELGSRLVDLLPEADDLDLVQLGPALDLLALNLRRDERLSLAAGPAADADIAVRG